MCNTIGVIKSKAARKTEYKVLLCAILFLANIIVSCQPENLQIKPTETIIPTVLQTATNVWFPLTSTVTPITMTRPTGTPNFRPGIETFLLFEDFQNSDHWTVGNTGNGTIAIANNQLSLAITNPGGYLFSVRDGPMNDDFYVEVIAAPSICQGIDEYGMLIRYNSPVDFYRFSLSCDGKTRLDKLNGGVASSPQPWLASTSIPTAAPSTTKLGVWVSGNDMRFFINDEFQFSNNDPTFKSGLIGFFARSGGANAVSVSFSELTIYQVDGE